LIVAVALLRIPLKKAPKWFMGVLWTIVALRLLVPLQVESGFGFMPDFGQVTSMITETEASNDSNIYASEDTVVPSTELTQNEASADINGVSKDALAKENGTLRYLTILWIVGMLMALGYASYSYVSIRLKTRVSIRYRSSDKVYVCDDIDTPFIFGLVKPVIYLPSGLDHDTIVNVIAHEKAHLKRKDHLRKGLGFFILTIHWFNPFVWLSYILFCRDIELACDERVISTMSTDEKKSYAESLLSCSTKKRRMMVYPVAFGEVAVGTRIRQIFNYKKPTFYLVLLLVVITGTLATCSFTRAADKVTITPYKIDVVSAPDRIRTENVEAIAEPVMARTRIEEIRWKEESEEVKVGQQAKADEIEKSTSSVPSEVKIEDNGKGASADVKEGNTHVSVSADDLNKLTSVEPVKEVVNATEDIVDEVTDGILIDGGIADTAVDTAFSITTDTLGLVDSILGW
jgi:beta-lactamase regulating signal transducer with metallopeptidase domain/PBP1b-binding outer membrane lipoprotein LpoB